MSPSALACPASLKGCLSAAVAAEALAVGLRRAGVAPVNCPWLTVGRGPSTCSARVFETVETVDAFGRPRVARAGVLEDGTRVVEAAEAIPLDPSRLDVLAASSRGLGLWMARYRDCPLVVTVGGTATMDAGLGLLEVLDRLPGPTRVLCDVATTLYDAPRLFGPQKGATSDAGRRAGGALSRGRAAGSVRRSARIRRGRRARRRARVARRGARARRGGGPRPARFRPGALRPRRHRGGHGRRDDLGGEGAGGSRARAARPRRPLRRLRRTRPGTVPGDSTPLVALSGDPARAREDLVELGKKLGRGLAGGGA